jgi:undecaprenyl-diphosphatase
MRPTGRTVAERDVRFVLGVSGVVLSGLAVHDHDIGPVETAVFRAVNRLPDGLYPPGWVVMQAGNVGAAPVAGLAALCAGRPRLAARLTVTGVLTWTLAKLIKRGYRRPRPARLMRDVRCRGKEASGLGYVSGHAGIAAGIGVAVFPHLRTPARLATAVAVPVVGLCRIYVGAHLPLDVLGGAALGLAVDAAVSELLPDEPVSRASRVPAPPARVPRPARRAAPRGTAPSPHRSRCRGT